MDDKKDWKILIIEDGKLNQKILVDTLQDSYTLSIIDTGKDVMKTVRRTNPHLILLDIILPDANGFDILKQLKAAKDTQNIPVIIITGLDNDKDEEKGLSMGAVDYIRKPFNNFLVKARVNIHIQIVKQLATIEKLSYFDALTDLSNRRRFDYHVAYEWNRAIRKKSLIGILMMDLDNFKDYNDSFGHTQGDEMLKAVAGVLKKILSRSTDVPCRWGGEEFAVLIPETTREDLLLIAERIRSAIEALEVPNSRTNEITKITVSIGAVCEVPLGSQNLPDFIDKADGLLYRAKSEGRNRVHLLKED